MEVPCDKWIGNYKILKEYGLWSIKEVDRGNSKEFGLGHYHVTLKKDSILLIIVHIVTCLYIELTTLLRKPFEL